MPTSAALATLRGVITLIRPTQWIKNAFVLAPLLFSAEFLNSHSVVRSVLAALLFCVASSAVYIVNDWHDIENDRRHATKRLRRPLASGAVTTRTAGVVLIILYGLLLAGWTVAPNAVSVMVAYILMNLAYTRVLKHQPVIDIFIIAFGFVLRVYAGALALSVPVSEWMFVTTLCLALYLAAIKRRQEFTQTGAEARHVLKQYSVPLVERYAEMSATGALVFYSIFVMAARPELVITIPLVLFGLFRYWYVVEVHGRGESPTDALLADFQLLATVVLWAALCAWAVWPQ